MKTNIFVNIAVRDLEKSKRFFEQLGFTFNPQFTDETAASMVVDDTLQPKHSMPYQLIAAKQSMPSWIKSWWLVAASSANQKTTATCTRVLSQIPTVTSLKSSGWTQLM